MGILASIKRELRSHPSNPSEKFLAMFGKKAASGVDVTPDVALTIMAVYASVRILAETVGSLPLFLYRRRKSGGKDKAKDHPAYPLVHDAANEEQTSMEWREMLTGHVVLRGNSYSGVDFNRMGQPAQLVPIHPDNVKIKRNEKGQLIYEISRKGRPDRTLMRPRVLHLKGLSSDGVYGISPIRVAREALGLAIATEEYGARFFGNNATPTGILSYEDPSQEVDEKTKRDIKEGWLRDSGGENKLGIAVLEGGLKWTQVGIDAEDAQFLATRKFQVTEIARMFRIPPHMLADLERATFSNIEHQAIEFVVHTIRPWLVRWEQALNQTLLKKQEREEYFFEFNVDGLLRGDIESRFKAYAVARNWGWMSADDVLELENRNPLPDGKGKVYLQPLNTVPAGDFTSDDERSLFLERRQQAVTNVRLNVRKAHRALFQDAFGRIVTREVRELKAAINKHLVQRDLPSFSSALTRFYDGFAGTMEQIISPVFSTYAQAVDGAVENEIGAAPIDDDLDRSHLEVETRQLEEDARSYTSRFANSYILAARGQLEQIIEDNRDSEDLGPLLLERVDEWEEKKAKKTARRQLVNAESVFARAAYRSRGVRKLKWVSIGRNCPICNRLDGKVIGIEANFLEAGETLDPEDGVTAPLTPRRPVGGPQAHDGCDCAVIAAF